ncbi:MAG TPA: PEP-CTERM sorting domain-containing protein, partial [Verrucomicrobiae bacterium]|nr:PEP-CTERM sorting domain-containing protein [Verrucomicrobiae bacterium]
DPVLVTTAGPDRVLMQCFPVPPNGGRMKVRIGITSPLHLLDREHGLSAWPRFIERNFSLAENLKRSIWVASRAELSCAADQLQTVAREDGSTGLQGELAERELADPHNVLRVHRALPAPDEVWAHGEANVRIEQGLRAITDVVPRKLVVVLDGSASMTSEWTAIADSLSAIDSQVDLTVIIATDRADDGWVELGRNDREAPVIDQVRKYIPVGGQDNVPALRRGWDLAAEHSGNALLWIHTPIPVLLESTEGLHQRLERNLGVVRLLDFQIGEGPNRLVEQLDGLRVKAAVRQGRVAEDLGTLMTSLVSESPQWVFERKQWAGVPNDKGEPASKHVARLWAGSEVQSLAGRRKFDRAVKLAQDYQLVTPWTGAVVLESQSQYDAAKLSPVDAATVPVVPEPAVVWLLLAGVAVWFLRNRLGRRKRFAAGRPAR